MPWQMIAVVASGRLDDVKEFFDKWFLFLKIRLVRFKRFCKRFPGSQILLNNDGHFVDFVSFQFASLLSATGIVPIVFADDYII